MGNSPKNIIKPIADINADTTGAGINLVNLPNPSTPKITCKTPQINPITIRLLTPYCAIHWDIRTVIAIAGPVIAKVVPPKIAATKLPTIAEIIPISGSTPEASATAKDNGIATSATIIPAIKSLNRYWDLNILPNSVFRYFISKYSFIMFSNLKSTRHRL